MNSKPFSVKVWLKTGINAFSIDLYTSSGNGLANILRTASRQPAAVNSIYPKSSSNSSSSSSNFYCYF